MVITKLLSLRILAKQDVFMLVNECKCSYLFDRLRFDSVKRTSKDYGTFDA